MKDKTNRFYRCYVMALLVLGVSSWAVDQQEIIAYYWHKAASAYTSHDPLRSGQKVSFTCTATVRQLTRNGKIRTSEQSVNRYYFSWGKLDSTVFVSGEKHPTFPVDITVPDIFDSTYNRTFFPNDIGDPELAIGFDTDTSADPRPVGIVTIDRNRCTVRRLHVAYRQKERYERFSRSFHFVDVGNWVVADSIVETGALRGFLVNEDYQTTIVISDVTIQQPALPSGGK